MADFCCKKFLLSYSFSFDAYAENLREKTTKSSLKTTEVLWDADGHGLA